ncbi:MAG TPA: hypothetical protein VFV34_16045 [Blastocatellia bacterium]|nr:hypothetical protein [Blastocatellia bacterium]
MSESVLRLELRLPGVESKGAGWGASGLRSSDVETGGQSAGIAREPLAQASRLFADYPRPVRGVDDLKARVVAPTRRQGAGNTASTTACVVVTNMQRRSGGGGVAATGDRSQRS